MQTKTMSQAFDISKLQMLQDAFAKKVGVASLMTHSDGQPVTQPSNFSRLCMHVIRKTEKGNANCMHSDSMIGRKNPSGPIVQPCMSGGLWDSGASICVNGEQIGSWLVGQVMNEAQDLNKMMDYGREIEADMDEFSYALSFVTIMSKSTFMSISDALFLFTQQLSRMVSDDESQFDDFGTGRNKLLALIEKERRLSPLLEVWDTMQDLVDEGSLLRAA